MSLNGTGSLLWVLASALTSHIGLHYNPLASQNSQVGVFYCTPMEHFLTGFFCRKKDFWHIQSCRGENSNLAEFAQMRQKRMGIGAIKTSFKGSDRCAKKERFGGLSRHRYEVSAQGRLR